MTGRDALLLDDGHHVFLAHDEELFAVDLHFGAAVLAEKDVVAHLHVEGTHFTVLEDLALTHSDDLALDRLLSRRIGDHDATGGSPLLFKALDDHSIVQRANLQFVSHSSNLDQVEKVFKIRGLRGVSVRVSGYPLHLSTHPRRVLIIGLDAPISRGRRPATNRLTVDRRPPEMS